MSFNVYFHTKKVDDALILAVQIYEGMEKFEPQIKEINLVRDATFLDEGLESFLYALDIIEGEGFDDVVLNNQNGLFFKWLGYTSHESKMRESYYKKIKEQMTRIVENNETTIGYRVIKGDKNEAKKEIKKYEKSRVIEVNDITGLFKSDKVVQFKKNIK